MLNEASCLSVGLLPRLRDVKSAPPPCRAVPEVQPRPVLVSPPPPKRCRRPLCRGGGSELRVAEAAPQAGPVSGGQAVPGLVPAWPSHSPSMCLPRTRSVRVGCAPASSDDLLRSFPQVRFSAELQAPGRPWPSARGRSPAPCVCGVTRSPCGRQPGLAAPDLPWLARPHSFLCSSQCPGEDARFSRSALLLSPRWRPQSHRERIFCPRYGLSNLSVLASARILETSPRNGLQALGAPVSQDPGQFSGRSALWRRPQAVPESRQGGAPAPGGGRKVLGTTSKLLPGDAGSFLQTTLHTAGASSACPPQHRTPALFFLAHAVL